MRYVGIFLFLIIVCSSTIAQTVVVRGKVIDAKGPVAYATVQSISINRSVYTDNFGSFQVAVDSTRIKLVDLTIKMVGKRTISSLIDLRSANRVFIFALEDLSLSLDEVQVTEVRKAMSSNSSLVFDRQAIEQVQAFSLADILNNLPGKTVAPPQLHNPSNLTLRSEAAGIQALNNSLGTAIILDDIQFSNNANMQNRNVGKFGIAGSGISSRSNGGFDVAFGGIDIREIPADNIESVEVILGVAPAKYGDLTDGAVIINRQAGKTNYQFSSRINAGSSNFSLSKGFLLDKRIGSINFSLNYLNSVEDPSDPIKSYDRVSSGAMWTSYFFKDFKNTLSIDYSTRLDDVKLDPDVGREYMTYAKSRNLSISNRSSVKLNNRYLKSINLSAGYSTGYQESYNQVYLNSPPKAVADKDTTGLYEGYFIPGNYLAVEHLIGSPVNLNGNINLESELKTGNLVHFLSLGTNIYYSDNNGQGVVVNPQTPRWENLGYQNERPYDYELIPAIFNYGLYLQNNVTFDVLKRPLKINAGLRLDVQNNYKTLQPRINLNYTLAKNVTFNGAFGIATKGPSMSHRYPAPVYFDFPILTNYTGSVVESLYLVYTDKIVPNNSDLKPSKTSQVEFGMNYQNRRFSSSVFGYYKKSTNGFSNLQNYRGYVTPQFNYEHIPGQRPNYSPNGNYRIWLTSFNTSANDLNSDNYGIEWMISTRKIKSIESSFNLSSSFNYSNSKNQTERYIQANSSFLNENTKAWIGIYEPTKSINYSIISKLTTTTHIPKLGFVINLLSDIFWQRSARSLRGADRPVAYLDANMIRHEITDLDPNNLDYKHLVFNNDLITNTRLPFIYANFSARLAKEINKNIRMSVNAYNVFNIRNRYYNEISDSVTNYTYPVSVGAELSIKF